MATFVLDWIINYWLKGDCRMKEAKSVLYLPADGPSDHWSALDKRVENRCANRPVGFAIGPREPVLFVWLLNATSQMSRSLFWVEQKKNSEEKRMKATITRINQPCSVMGRKKSNKD